MKPPAILLLAVPRRLFCFGSLVILDVVCRYLSLFLLYINIKIGKIDVNCQTSRQPPVWEIAVHLAVACDVFDGVFFVLSFFPRDVLGEIWDLIESFSEGFSFYFCIRS